MRPTLPRVLALALVATLAISACGSSSHGPTTPPASAAVGDYAALRWVPADVSYAVVSRRSDDVSLVLRELFHLVNTIAGYDPAQASAASQEVLGVDLMSSASLTDAGLDAARGLAVFGQRLSPTFAVPIADPARVQQLIDGRREGGVAVAVSQRHGAEVFSWLGDRDVHIHWTVTEGWLLVHFEATAEHEVEGAWFDAAHGAAAGFAAGPDFAAAVAAGAELAGPTAGSGPPPIVGVAHIPALVAAFTAQVPESRPCLVSLGSASRVLLAAGARDREPRAVIRVALGADAAGVRGAVLPPLPGWTAARAEAPLQLDLSLDLIALHDRMAACVPPPQLPVRTAHVYVHTVDVDQLEGRGAILVHPTDRGMLSTLLDEIPGRSMMEKRRRIGAIDVVDVNVPLLPGFSYAQPGDQALIAMGAGEMDRAAAAGPAPSSGAPVEIGHARLLPDRIPTSAWEAGFEALGLSAHAGRTAQTRMKRWTWGQVDLVLEGDELVLRAAAKVAAP